MKRIFVTFFNSRFLPQAIALHASLEKNSPNFSLWALCMDTPSYLFLKNLKLSNLIPIAVSDFEDESIRNVKREPHRSYYGTIKPALIKYVVERNPDCDIITYIDTDIFFFSSPDQLFEVFDDSSVNVLITPHRFPAGKEGLAARNGIYNAGIAMFRNNLIGRSCIENWRKKCLERCENRVGLGTYGDQGYLDAWASEFPGVHSHQAKGVNVGPWNVGQYLVRKENRFYYVDNDPLIFYHFSSLRILATNQILLFDYAYHKDISKNLRATVYRDYCHELLKAMGTVRTIEPNYPFGFEQGQSHVRSLLGHMKYDLVQFHIELKRKFSWYKKLHALLTT